MGGSFGDALDALGKLTAQGSVVYVLGCAVLFGNFVGNFCSSFKCL